ncbi:Teneurin-1 (Ten-1) (Protein Odd Oz/ten-m homolog 1) (Tenascin-M1) (Ten-m1) (Teneurin transmembrane protein 1) [Cleaved into: Ten-1 intracellular domain (IDten-1) (Ten-1 ICD) [Durusdinium trenchii]|uniref:Teneurin-1 (Ten-1) (Protein Odd Oz/ten-m homolog 1) (Tenascin-M1) (Ten-m1) (Teneurin transmembrane protein 1) [Cleaved into: Ten-1 intracellular domain (IDten-1) (Ten-1 ICD) n=1 Tax=Durusdinium trenchii TaxID=1381693 RepID=A0ABP0N8V3_9DINO
MLLRWLPAAALLAVPLEAALLNQIDPLPPQTSPLTFAQSLKEAQDTFAAADKFFAAARLEHARDRESVERMERAVAQHQAEIPGMEFAGMQDPLPLRQTQQRTSPLAFAQSRKAAEDAWAAADKLFAAARLENTRDSVERVEHAVARARRHQAEIPGAEFAGMQAPPAADMHPCKMDCSNQGLCLAGKCMCRDGFYGDLCEHPRCLNDCSGHGQCLTGQCKCSSNYGGEDCSQLIQTQSSLAFLRRGLAAESAELAKQSSQSPSAKVSQVVTKACPLNCNSRGDCRDGTCECHDGWTGSSCQDYLQPALVDLTEGQSTSSCANQCSGHGVCESNGCKCHEGYRGEACDEAFQLEQPLQLKLQQVSKEDEQHTVTCPGGCGHGICKVGICDCDAGWQGTSCSISDEAALQGLEEQAALSSVPAAASWIGTGHADEVGTRALRAAPNQVTVPKTQLSAIQGQTEQGQRASSSFGVQAASALNRWLKSAKKVSSERPVDQLASLLSSAAMPAFALLERISCAVCTEVGRDLGIDLAQMPCETSSTMRCIHYDRPLESRGDGDLQAPARAPAIGTHVRLVGLQGAEASLNGLKGCVTDADADTAVVSLSGAPEAVLHQRASETVTVQLGHLRVLWSQAPGMYPAHTDSSLVTLAPRSSAPGLEVKDLQTGEWFNVEEALLPDDCLLFVGDPLDYASAHQYPALMHRPAVCGQSKGGGSGEHRISTPFFLYPRAEAVLAPQKLPRLVFDDLNGNVNGCRDRFPWKKHTCYYSDLVYSESKD